jgi:putative flippase GtrA
MSTKLVRSSPEPPARRLRAQLPAFAAVGVVGYLVDSVVTYLGAKYLGLSPELARPPGFVVATVVNFLLNRAITFRDSRAPLSRAFLRYCGVASLGLAVSYAVYSLCLLLATGLGIAVAPAMLPLFIAAGTGGAMIVTFIGFRSFAFRP